jgi:hypothetical protein
VHHLPALFGFCPYGIDMAEMTLLGREMLSSVGINIEWALASVGSCYTRGSHIGALPRPTRI